MAVCIGFRCAALRTEDHNIIAAYERICPYGAICRNAYLCQLQAVAECPFPDTGAGVRNVYYISGEKNLQTRREKEKPPAAAVKGFAAPAVRSTASSPLFALQSCLSGLYRTVRRYSG